MYGPQIEVVGADADLEEILSAVSGDPEVVGALSALKPQLGAALSRAAQNRNRRMIEGGDGSFGRKSNTHLPMTNGSNSVAAAASVSLTGTPLRAFKPFGLIVQTDGNMVTVESVTIANQPQLAGSTGSVARDAFARDTVIPFALDWDVIPQNQSIVAVAKNQHSATAAGIFGSVYGKYTQPG